MFDTHAPSQGPVVLTRATTHPTSGADLLVATHKRDGGRAWRMTASYDYGRNAYEQHRALALALLSKHFELQPGRCWQLVAMGHDQNHYFHTAETANADVVAAIEAVQ